jgi:hypothetical protein
MNRLDISILINKLILIVLLNLLHGDDDDLCVSQQLHGGDGHFFYDQHL